MTTASRLALLFTLATTVSIGAAQPAADAGVPGGRIVRRVADWYKRARFNRALNRSVDRSISSNQEYASFRSARVDHHMRGANEMMKAATPVMGFDGLPGFYIGKYFDAKARARVDTVRHIAQTGTKIVFERDGVIHRVTAKGDTETPGATFGLEATPVRTTRSTGK